MCGKIPMKKFFILLLSPLVVLGCDHEKVAPVIVDSNMTHAEALMGSAAPQSIIDVQELISVQYYGSDGRIHQGQLVVHHDIVPQVQRIFDVILKEKFPLGRVVPIVAYDLDDNRSMADNNSSGFNYRYISGTRQLSKHATGLAIDINPVWNPLVYKSNNRIVPLGAKYDVSQPGTIYPGHPVYEAFIKEGFKWGGDFKKYADHHHFEFRY